MVFSFKYKNLIKLFSSIRRGKCQCSGWLLYTLFSCETSVIVFPFASKLPAKVLRHFLVAFIAT